MLRIGLIDDDSAQESTDVFVCPFCGKEYKSAESMAKHIKDKHPDEKVIDDDSPQE